MRYAKIIFVAFAMALIMPLSLKVYSQETNQETKADAAGAVIQETKPTLAAEGKNETKETGHDHSMGSENRFVATIGTDGVQHVEVIGGDYYFDPNYIIVKVSVPVELKVKKAPGYIPHDIAVKAPKAGTVATESCQRKIVTAQVILIGTSCQHNLTVSLEC